jgi:hypothetical protein
MVRMRRGTGKWQRGRVRFLPTIGSVPIIGCVPLAVRFHDNVLDRIGCTFQNGVEIAAHVSEVKRG